VIDPIVRGVQWYKGSLDGLVVEPMSRVGFW